MKKHLILLVVAFLYVGVKGQGINYQVTSDNPYDIKKSVIHLDPFYVEMWNSNFNMGLGLRLNHILNEKTWLGLAFRRSYLDHRLMMNFNNKITAKNGQSALIYIEPLAEFILSDNAKKKSLRIVLSEQTTYHGDYKTTHTKFINVPGYVRQVVSARGGFFFVNSSIDVTDGEAASTFVATDKKDKENSFVFGEYGKQYGGSNVYDGYTMMKVASLYGGISLKYINDLNVHVNGWGNRRNAIILDMYFDVMYAPVISYSNVETADKTEWKIKNTNTNHIGWRAGIQYRPPTKTWLSADMSFGTRPGHKGKEKGFLAPRIFLNCTIGIAIPTNKYS